MPSVCRAFHPCLRPRALILGFSFALVLVLCKTCRQCREPLQTARHMRTFHMSGEEDLTRHYLETILSRPTTTCIQQKRLCSNMFLVRGWMLSQQPPAQETCCNDWLCGRRPHRSRRVGNRRYPRGNRTHEKVEVEQMAFQHCDVNTTSSVQFQIQAQVQVLDVRREMSSEWMRFRRRYRFTSTCRLRF